MDFDQAHFKNGRSLQPNITLTGLNKEKLRFNLGHESRMELHL
jgi:hypothetical protein